MRQRTVHVMGFDLDADLAARVPPGDFAAASRMHTIQARRDAAWRPKYGQREGTDRGTRLRRTVDPVLVAVGAIMGGAVAVWLASAFAQIHY